MTEEVNIFLIEQLVYDKKYTGATYGLHKMLMDFRNGNHFATVTDSNRISPEITSFYTRLTRCISNLFLDYEYRIDYGLFTSWLVYARELRAIITISGFYHTDFLMGIFDQHFKKAIAEHSAGTNRLVEIEQLAFRLLMFSMLENDLHVDFNIFFRFFPAATITAIFSLLAALVVVTPKGFEKRERLLDLIPLFEEYSRTEKVTLLDTFLDRFVVWMLCSYANRRDKHAIKRAINNNLIKWLTDENIMPQTAYVEYNPEVAKPTLLVVLEFFHSWHSMGRSYGAALKDLKEKFKIVGLVLQYNSEEIKDKNYEYLDEVVFLECYDPNSIIVNTDRFRIEMKKIADVKADMIFYPSLGMHQLAITLANMRLAPIQMMSFGHPASSFCDTIDYGIIEADYAPEAEDLFSEKMILLPPESFISQPLEQARNFIPEPKKTPEIIHIAISSSLPKVSASFLNVCKKIAEQSKRRIAFLFFMNETEAFYLQCKKDILQHVPEAQVLHRLPFDLYLAYLSICDLYISTFPFGGANSVIDAMCVGLPVVCLRGEDIAGRTDSALILRRDLPTWLVAHSEEEYIAAALRLIHNDDERIALQEKIYSNNQELFPENNPNYQKNKHCFAEACWQIYQKHTALQKSSKKIFSFDELKALTI